MKTIYTSLPIYDLLAKQCYERAQRGHSGYNRPVPIICPQHRLPSFQWLADTENMGSVTTIELIDTAGSSTDITTYFPTLPAETVVTGGTYYCYNGDTLNWLLTAGIYYLKITTDESYILYSEWFKVDCVYENLVDRWIYADYNTFTPAVPTTDGEITSAINTGAEIDTCQSNYFTCIKGEVLTAIFYLTINSGETPYIVFSDGVALTDNYTLAAGLNVITITSPSSTATCHIRFENTNSSNWSISELYLMRGYSEKYLKVDFSNTCDLGDILYAEGFTQSLWFESETMETNFPQEEQGMNNGDGRFVRAFARQVKKYNAKTKEMPDFMVEVFNRMKLHDTIELTNLVGNVNDVYNLEVSHEWLGDDRYYASIELGFDYNEAFVVAGCCNNIT